MKVLIIDDDVQIREGITEGIDWKNLGIQDVRNCGNGLEGLRLVNSFNPDIVLADVRMPEVDGLEFLERAKKINPSIRVVMISGYSDFEYLQKAIRYGAEDYELKPLKVGKLIKLIRELRNSIIAEKESQVKVEEREELYQRNFLHNVISGKISDVNIISEYMRERMNNPEARMMICGVLSPDDGHWEENEEYYEKIEEFFSKEQEVCCMYVDSREIFLSMQTIASSLYTVNQKVKMKGLFEQMKREIFPTADISLGISSEVPIGKLARGYKEAKLCLDNRIYYGRNTISLTKTIQTINGANNLEKDLGCLRKKLYGAYKARDEDVIISEIQSLKMSVMKYKPCKLITIEDLLVEVCATINAWHLSIGNEFEVFSIPEIHKDLAELLFLDDYIEYAEDIFLYALKKQKDVYNAQYSSLVSKTLQYIDQHFAKNLTAELLGEYIGRTPNYFSHLFKKELGISFVEYLKRKRLEHAQELLNTTDLKIYEVANQVGFRDPVYFSQTYKKHYGVSPIEERRNKPEV